MTETAIGEPRERSREVEGASGDGSTSSNLSGAKWVALSSITENVLEELSPVADGSANSPPHLWQFVAVRSSTAPHRSQGRRFNCPSQLLQKFASDELKWWQKRHWTMAACDITVIFSKSRNRVSLEAIKTSTHGRTEKTRTLSQPVDADTVAAD
jgi:hypothetical protein